MPRRRWTIRDEPSLQTFLSYCGQERLQGRPVVVEEVPEKRSLDQNAISHAWYAEVSDYLGDQSPLAVKCESKLWCGVPLLRAEDDDFRNFYDLAIRRSLTYEQKLEAMKVLPVTSLMSKAQLSQYLESMQVYWRQAGVYLCFPEDFQRADFPEANNYLTRNAA